MAYDALILDGHLRSALTTARSLARRNVRVVCGASSWFAPTFRSRAVTDTSRYPDPLDDRAGFLEAVRKAAGDRPTILFTFSDRTTLAVSRNRDQLPSNVRLLLPSAPQVELCFDKERLAYAARNLGIPVPDMRPIESPSDIAAFGFPAIIKPRVNCFWKNGQGITASVALVRSYAEAEQAFLRLRDRTGEPPFLQRFVPGNEFGITALCRNGAILASAAHRRVRSLSPDGGASVLRQTIPMPSGPFAAASRLLEHLQWTGPAMVEFRGASEGSFALLEINGRVWGSLPLYEAAGLDYPMLAYAMASGAPGGPAHARGGILSRYLVGDTGWLVRSLFRGRVGAFWKYLRAFAPRIHEDVWRADDPAPFFWDILYHAMNRIR